MKTKQQIQERAWGIALDHYLAEYPEDKTPEEILELIEKEDDSIIFWEPFEYSSGNWIARRVWSMKEYMISELSWVQEEKIEMLTMQTSTINDIIANMDELKLKAEELITKWKDEEDWWENVRIGEYDFDFNIFYWKDEEGETVRIATVHPVAHDETGYGVTDMSNHVRLIIKKAEA